MKYIITLNFLLASIVSFSQEEKKNTFQPPIPTELMVGNEYSLFKMIVTKQLQDSRLKFFNLLSYEVNHNDLEVVNFFNQSVVFYNLNAGVSAGLGLNYKTFGGAKPLASVLLSKFGNSLGYIIQPIVELQVKGAKELFVLFEYVYQNKKTIQPYFRLDIFTSFLKKHDYSYFNWRLGINKNGLRFGPAINLQYFGIQGARRYNFGGFIQVLIF